MKHDHDLNDQHTQTVSKQNSWIHHSTENAELTTLAQQFLELEKHVHKVNASLREYLHASSVEDMISRMHGLNLSAKTLNILYAGIVLDKEDDVAMALKEIRQRTAATADDVADHLNYTAL